MNQTPINQRDLIGLIVLILKTKKIKQWIPEFYLYKFCILIEIYLYKKNINKHLETKWKRYTDQIYKTNTDTFSNYSFIEDSTFNKYILLKNNLWEKTFYLKSTVNQSINSKIFLLIWYVDLLYLTRFLEENKYKTLSELDLEINKSFNIKDPLKTQILNFQILDKIKKESELRNHEKEKNKNDNSEFSKDQMKAMMSKLLEMM